MDKDEIKGRIHSLTGGHQNYHEWTIGVTDRLDERRAEHDLDGRNTERWHVYEADDEDVARSVESFFIDNGMDGGKGGPGGAGYVYVF